MAPNNQENGVAKDAEVFTWEEVRKHNKPEDLWVVIDGNVYDVTRFKDKHPGLPEILVDSGGQDATRSFVWYHKDVAKPRRYMSAYKKGTVEDTKDPRWVAMDKDIDELEKKCKKMGLFNTSWTFQLAWFLQIVCFMSLSYWIVSKYFASNPIIAMIVSSFFFGAGQVMSGFQSHDAGHRSITHTKTYDKWFLKLFMNVLLGLSGKFWCAYHSRHHTKPNIINKDPTIKINERFFVIGTKAAETTGAEKGKKKESTMPYQYQHFYWFFVGVPLYVPVNFQLASLVFCLRRKEYAEMLCWMLFFVWYPMVFVPVLGPWTIVHFILARQTLTHWFVWTSLSNHLALDPVHDDPAGFPWLDIQITQTVNLSANRFCEWYHGGLNFQLEHHIFPHMPRDKLPMVAGLVEELCKKHGIPYRVLTTLDAYKQVYDMLKNSGERFLDVYMDALAGK